MESLLHEPSGVALWDQCPQPRLQVGWFYTRLEVILAVPMPAHIKHHVSEFALHICGLHVWPACVIRDLDTPAPATKQTSRLEIEYYRVYFNDKCSCA